MSNVEIVNDIRTTYLSENEVAEKERMEIVFSVRPKLKTVNIKLQQLTRTVKYTTVDDTWRGVDEDAHPETDKRDIVDTIKQRRRQIGKSVKP